MADTVSTSSTAPGSEIAEVGAQTIVETGKVDGECVSVVIFDAHVIVHLLVVPGHMSVLLQLVNIVKDSLLPY